MESWNILIKRGSIEFRNHKRIIEINLEPEAQVHGEILDEDAYKRLIEQNLEKEKIKPGKGDIILSNEVSYSKYFKIKDKKINPAEYENFKNEIPVEPEKAVTKLLLGKDKYGMVGANKELFTILAGWMDEKKWKIERVTMEIFKKYKGKMWDLR